VNRCEVQGVEPRSGRDSGSATGSDAVCTPVCTCSACDGDLDGVSDLSRSPVCTCITRDGDRGRPANSTGTVRVLALGTLMRVLALGTLERPEKPMDSGLLAALVGLRSPQWPPELSLAPLLHVL